MQILTPFRVRTAAGVVELNRTLEDIINPPVSGKKELVIGKDVFRVGDKIIQNKNTALISNGDMGTILDFDEDEEGNPKISILFTENRMIEYELEQMEMIEHANAITVHKSQGSECPIVITVGEGILCYAETKHSLYCGDQGQVQSISGRGLERSLSGDSY